MAAKEIVCDSSVIRGMSNDPRNICYHYRHHLVGKQVYHCKISFREVVDSLVADCQISRYRAESLFTRWRVEFRSKPLPPTSEGEKVAAAIQQGLSVLEGLIPEKTAKHSKYDCHIAGETIAQGIAELAAHDRDFLFIEVVCGDALRVIMLQTQPDGHPRQRLLASQHKQRLENA